MTGLKTDEAEQALAEHLTAARALNAGTVPGLTDSQKLSGDVGQYLTDELCNAMRLRFGGEDYEVAGTDELGLPHDPYADPILRRKSDGRLFEVEIDVYAREYTPPKQGVPG